MNLRRTIEVSVMIAAAFLEVGGDALIRKGMRGGTYLSVALGFCILGSYGLLVTSLELDFSKALGAYVGWFAAASLTFGWLVFRDRISLTTWIGLAIVLVGSLVMQFGATRAAVESGQPIDSQ